MINRYLAVLECLLLTALSLGGVIQAHINLEICEEATDSEVLGGLLGITCSDEGNVTISWTVTSVFAEDLVVGYLCTNDPEDVSNLSLYKTIPLSKTFYDTTTNTKLCTARGCVSQQQGRTTVWMSLLNASCHFVDTSDADISILTSNFATPSLSPSLTTTTDPTVKTSQKFVHSVTRFSSLIISMVPTMSKTDVVDLPPPMNVATGFNELIIVVTVVVCMAIFFTFVLVILLIVVPVTRKFHHKVKVSEGVIHDFHETTIEITHTVSNSSSLLTIFSDPQPLSSDDNLQTMKPSHHEMLKINPGKMICESNTELKPEKQTAVNAASQTATIIDDEYLLDSQLTPATIVSSNFDNLTPLGDGSSSGYITTSDVISTSYAYIKTADSTEIFPISESSSLQEFQPTASGYIRCGLPT